MRKKKSEKEWDTCRRCGDTLESAPIEYYPYCSEYCEDRAMHPEGEDEPEWTDRLRDGFKHLRD